MCIYTYRASSLAARGLQNLPVLSILGRNSLEDKEGGERESVTVGCFSTTCPRERGEAAARLTTEPWGNGRKL